MKKNSRLSLNKETLLNLRVPEMYAIIGGDYFTNFFGGATCSCPENCKISANPLNCKVFKSKPPKGVSEGKEAKCVSDFATTGGGGTCACGSLPRPVGK